MINKILEKNRVEFYSRLYHNNVRISPTALQLLDKHNLLYPEVPDYSIEKAKKVFDSDFSTKTPEERALDEHVDVATKGPEDDVIIISKAKYKKDPFDKTYRGGSKISKIDWLPHSGNVLKPEREFVEFIDSMSRGFSHRGHYEKFELYKQQAVEWLSVNDSITHYYSHKAKVDYVRNERSLISENKLYGLNQYIWLKDSNEPDGKRRYKAWEPQMFMSYIFDCGFNALWAKLRQVGFTSTMGGIFILVSLCRNNHFIKFIASDKETGEEIFEDKIKFVLSELPEHLSPSVTNDRDNLLKFARKKDKGKIRGINSRIFVDAPTLYAINGGSPDVIGLDEIGMMNILGKMILEGRPTLFRPDENNQQIMARQLFGWGTGGKMDKGGGEFRNVFMSAKKAWEGRLFSYGIIPIFIDCYSKPGITTEFYEQERDHVYREAEGDPEGEDKIIQFHQAYPITLDDVFLESTKTIIPLTVINKRIEAIWHLPAKEKPVQGYFLPTIVEGISKESNLDGKITGINFIPTKDLDPMATVTIIKEPEKLWTYRYFEGTDPISSEAGHSMMSAAIWDNYLNETSAYMNYREPYYKNCYLQAIMLGLFYDPYIKNLHEFNIGSGFKDYVENLNLLNTLVPNMRLPKYLSKKGGDREYGIGKHAQNSRYIIAKLTELLGSYVDNINVELLFVQLKTFVQKYSAQGEATYKVKDPRKYFDDMIDAIVYSYINAAYVHKLTIPRNSGAAKAQQKIRPFTRDDRGNLRKTTGSRRYNQNSRRYRR